MKKGNISEYNEAGEEGETARYEQGEQGEAKAKGKKVGISGKGGKKGGSVRAHHHSAHQVKHDGMAHKTHHEKNKAHGTPGGFVTGTEYAGGQSASKGCPSMAENEASCD